MPDDNKQNKPGGKTGEILLGILGALGDIAGPLLTGRDIGFGGPFKMGAAYLGSERTKNDLMKALSSTPQTAELGNTVGKMLQDSMSTGKSVFENVATGQDLMSKIGDLSSTGLSQPAAQQPSLAPGIGQELSGMGQVPGMESNTLDTSQLGDMGIGMTSGGMPTNMPSEPNVGGQVNLQDPLQLAQRLAQFGFTKEAIDVVSKGTTGQSDVMDRIREALQMDKLIYDIQNRQTPEEKGRLTQSFTQENMGFQAGLNRENQAAAKQEAARIKLGQWGVSEQKDLTQSLDNLYVTRSMLSTINSGISQNALSALVGKSAIAQQTMILAGRVTVEEAQQYRELRKLVMTAVKSQSGVQYGFRELQWIKSAMPSEWDTPEMFRFGVSMLHNNATWHHISQVYNKARRAGDPNVAYGEGFTDEQMAAFKILDAQLNKRAITPEQQYTLFSDPQNAKLLEQLNMVMVEPPTPKKKA